LETLPAETDGQEAKINDASRRAIKGEEDENILNL